MKGLSKINKHY